MYLYTMKTMLAILCIGTMFSCARRAENKVFEEKVILALEQQLERYPHSTVRDVYKNFFQDKFGPGHLLEDTSAAGRYLRRELASYDPDTLPVKGPYIDSTGWEHRFVRVDLRVIEEGKVSYEVFFEAFVRSVQAAPSVPLGSWKNSSIPSPLIPVTGPIRIPLQPTCAGENLWVTTAGNTSRPMPRITV